MSNLALAHDHLFQIGGAERILHEFSELYPQAPIFTLISDKNRNSLFQKSLINTSYLQKLPLSSHYFKWLLPLMPTAWESFSFDEYDVVLSSSSAFVKGLITQPKTLHICYCHTPTRYLWSDSQEYVHNLHLPGIAKVYLRHLLSQLRQWDELAAQRVDYFIANSNFIAEKIKKYYHRDSIVIYPPVKVNDFSLSETIEPYYLIISRLRPYKRVDLAIKAFNALRLPLYIIGGGEEYKHLKSLAKANIRFLGEVTDQQRNYYLSRCQALIHPQEEDFGITIIEAMASGRPVIAYGSGGATETVQNNLTGKLFFEQTWESLADAIINFRSLKLDPSYIRQQALPFDSKNFRQAINNLVQKKVAEHASTN